MNKWRTCFLMTKTMLSILKILDANPDQILGSGAISKQLKMHGVDLTERTVRYHLRILDERGFTKGFGKEEKLKETLRIMKPVFLSPYVMSEKVALKKAGEKIGDVLVPKGQVGFGTVC